MQIWLPYPPSVNHYYRRRRSGVYLSAKARNFRNACLAEIWRAGTVRVPPPSSLEIELYPPDNRRRDIDNVLKATLDVLQAAKVIRDDVEIEQLFIWRRECSPGGRLWLSLSRMR